MSNGVFIIEDHRDFATALAMVFDGDAKFHVCGIAYDTKAALEFMPTAGADLVMVDVSLPSGSGLDLIPELKVLCPAARFLAPSNEDPFVFAPIARDVGAAGFLRKGTPPAHILEVAEMVLRGEHYFPGLSAGL